MFGIRFEIDFLFILKLKNKRLQVLPAAFFKVIIKRNVIQGLFN